MTDPSETDTEHLNAKMRTAIDALRSQISGNAAAPKELRDAMESLNQAAVRFTNTLYAGEANLATRRERKPQ